MPRAKRARKNTNKKEEHEIPSMPEIMRWFWREMMPLLRAPRRRSKPARHLRNATIEMMEAMKAFLDEGIEWLKQEEAAPEIRRIKVED